MMAGTPILGPIAFTGFEVPERVSLGGKQRLVVHTLPGGGRVVDAMGPDDAPIHWSGVFSGSTAAERVRILERLRRGGQVLSLAWDAWRYNVIIQEFLFDVTSSWWIPYRIRLCVLPDTSDLSDDVTSLAGSLSGVGETSLWQSLAEPNVSLASSDLGTAVQAAGQVAQIVATWAGN